MDDLQTVRDLLWVVNSPSLIDGAQVADSTVLDVDQIDPVEFSTFLSENRNHRVGRYFERLVLFWLERIRRVRIVTAGEQIRDGNRTLGEIDFIFEDEAGRLTHWETAVKFFLHFPNDEGSHFPGPNASDNFERKMTKLFEKQLRFSEEHYPEVEVRQAFVKGMLFYHADVDLPDELPDKLSPDHQRGTWIRESELDRLDAFRGWCGEVMSKPNWLSRPLVPQCLPLDSLRQNIEQHFHRTNAPIMVSLVREEADEQRFFVVPDSWPRLSNNT